MSNPSDVTPVKKQTILELVLEGVNDIKSTLAIVEKNASHARSGLG